MPSIPALAPRITLRLIDGDKYTIPGLVRNPTTKAPVDLTDWKGALQVRKAIGDATVILTLATAAYTGFTNSTGCSIEILDQTDPDTKGRFRLIFDLDGTALTPGSFTAEEENGQATGRLIGAYDLEFKDSGGAPKKYLRGTAVFVREVTEPAP